MKKQKHDEARRAFLVGAAVTGAAAGAALVPAAHAQDHNAPQGANAPVAHSDGGKLGAFLNQDDAAAVEAFAERLMPGAPGQPGARDAGVLNYIDLALAGAYADQQDFYRRGLAALEDYCRKAHGKSFVQLGAAQQDEVIKAVEEGKAAGFTWPSAQAFFNTLRTHTIEGMFADPVYGGNKDFAGWRLVGFPGAQPAFSQADMQSRQAFTDAPMTGLQAKAPVRRG
ncbi:MAG: gluconate 2-dehydrogenase gamma chain [Alphaproteobacteria bacterium]|jgi:gluconate 2-dehydrogenase gamma chain|nr:gluconate 2-dehydrogenase gamma chain [Alphaproteobacteria bacterium]